MGRRTILQGSAALTVRLALVRSYANSANRNQRQEIGLRHDSTRLSQLVSSENQLSASTCETLIITPWTSRSLVVSDEH
jgi:hypothetical protein